MHCHLKEYTLTILGHFIPMQQDRTMCTNKYFELQAYITMIFRRNLNIVVVKQIPKLCKYLSQLYYILYTSDGIIT